MRALKKGRDRYFRFQEGIMGEVRLIERWFGIYSFQNRNQPGYLRLLPNFATGPFRERLTQADGGVLSRIQRRF